MRASDRDFRKLDDLVLDLKGLVLARSHRRRAGAGDAEIRMFTEEIERVKEVLAEFVRTGEETRAAA